MFISKLNSIIEAYDQYGEHRLNGLKVVYVLLVLYAANLFFSIPNPYFYYFYVPITVMSAEVAGQTIREKYVLFLYCLIMSVITIFIFNYFAPSWYLFIVVFLYSLLLYFLSVDNRQHIIVLAPVSLALGAYSLLYESLNTELYDIINNCITIFFAMILILAALTCFPRSYYYRLWLRAFLLLTNQIIEHLSCMIDNNQLPFDPVQGRTIHLVRFANMLPHSLPIFSILKINLLINQLHLIVSVAQKDALLINPQQRGKIRKFISELTVFKRAIEQEQPCELKTPTLVNLDKLIRSWNYLCLNL